MATAYSYRRFSHPSQAKGRSEDRQDEAAQEWCAKHGHELNLALKPDRGISALVGDNRVKGAFGEFLRMIAVGKVARGSFLLVEELDRISRESEVRVLNLLTNIALQGVRIVTLGDGEIYDENTDGMGWMRALMMAMRAHNESVTKTKRVRDAWEDKKSKARTDLKPYGESRVAWLRLKDQWTPGETGYEEITERVKLLRQMFRDSDAGIGVTKIAQRLNTAGVEAWGRGERGWQPAVVRCYLKSRACLGEYQPGKSRRGEQRTTDGEVITDYYPSVIDSDLFYRVQAKLAARDMRPAPGRRGKSLTNIFQGMCRCGACGGVVNIQAKGGGKRPGQPAYRCHNGWMKNGCDHRTRYRVPALEAGILRSIPDFDLRSPEGPDPLEAELDAATGLRDDLARKVENLRSMAEDGDADVLKWLRERRAQLDEQEARVTTLRNQLAASSSRMPTEASRAAVKALLSELDRAEGEDLYDVRARISEAVRSVVSDVEFHADGTVRVVLVGGLKAYHFNGATGDLIGGTDLLAKLGQRGVPPLSFFASYFGAGRPDREKAIVQMAAASAAKH